jgi:hypothetical protein
MRRRACPGCLLLETVIAPGRQTISDYGLFNPTQLSHAFGPLDVAGSESVRLWAFPICQGFVNSHLVPSTYYLASKILAITLLFLGKPFRISLPTYNLQGL